MAHETDAVLARYIRKVNAFPKLSREHELELCQRWLKNRDDRDRDALVRSNLRYVVAIAAKYHRYGLPLSELIAEGNVGIIHALSKFEPERGNRFVTYAAYWIRAYILTYTIRSWSLANVGSARLSSKLFFKLRRERIRVHNLVGEGDQANELLAERLGMPRDKLAQIMHRLDCRDVSLNVSTSDGTPTSKLDRLCASDCDQERAYIVSEDNRRMRDIVRTALNVLDKRERLILECHLGYACEGEISLAEVGRRLGVSRERARQLEARAIRKLKVRILELWGRQNLNAFLFESAA